MGESNTRACMHSITWWVSCELLVTSLSLKRNDDAWYILVSTHPFCFLKRPAFISHYFVVTGKTQYLIILVLRWIASLSLDLGHQPHSQRITAGMWESGGNRNMLIYFLVEQLHHVRAAKCNVRVGNRLLAMSILKWFITTIRQKETIWKIVNKAFIVSQIVYHL